MPAVIMDGGDVDGWGPASPVAASKIAMVTTALAERLAVDYNDTPGDSLGVIFQQFNDESGVTTIALPNSDSEVDYQTSVTCVVIKSAMVLLLSIIVTLANVVVLHVIRIDRTLHTVGNLFTASLAVADLFVGIFVIPFNIFDVLAVGSWQDHPNAARTIWVTLDFFFTTASIMNLVLLNLDRFWSITSPIKYIRQRTRRRATLLIAGVWGVPVVLIFGPATTWRLAFKDVAVPSRTMFVSYQSGSWLMAVSAVLIYIIPLVILCAIYSQIYRAIHRRSKMDVGRTSFASSAVSTRPGSSRRDSESQHNFITEHELLRLKGIYEKTVRRERGERQLMAMIRRRSRGYATGAREIQRYASIDEEDHCGENGDQERGDDNDYHEVTDRGSIYEGVNDSSMPSSDGKLADAESNDMDRNDNESEDSYEMHVGEREALMSHVVCDEDEKRKPILASNSHETDFDVSPGLRAKRKGDQMSLDSPASNSKPHLSPGSLKPDRLECDLFSNGMVMCPNCSPSSRGSSRGSSPQRRMSVVDDNASGCVNRLNLSPAKNGTSSFPPTPEKINKDVLNKKTNTDQIGTPIQNGDVVHCNGTVRKPSLLMSMQESSFTTSSENIETSPFDDRSISPTESDQIILSDADSETVLQKPSKPKTSFSFDLVNEVTHCRCSSTNVNDIRTDSRSLSYPKSDQRISLTFPMEAVPMNGFRNRVRKSLNTSFNVLSGRGSKALMLLRKQDKAAKQLGIILTCLIVCWTPYFFQVLLYSFVYSMSNTTAMTIAVYLGYAHSLLNPVLYALFNLRFQRAFRHVICACCFKAERSPRPCSVPPSLI